MQNAAVNQSTISAHGPDPDLSMLVPPLAHARGEGPALRDGRGIKLV
jgi:hypothetical protein